MHNHTTVSKKKAFPGTPYYDELPGNFLVGARAKIGESIKLELEIAISKFLKR